MNKINYDNLMEEILSENAGRVLLHSCCAPCSSTCIERLCDRCDVTVYYYNPNIGEEAEYLKRKEEQIRLINAYNAEKKGKFEIKILDADYDPDSFYRMAKGLETCPERGERCHKCYELRMRKTAEAALTAGEFDYFATTLTLSPLKDSEAINRIGLKIEEDTGMKYLPSDFKKRNGFLRSIELSKQYDLYRQDYCGCVYSKVSRNCEKCGNCDEE
ncbi:MAG: epoxyqueuosine reductase QueH [Lachnospiraceae bacterium]|jgi:predicted adenine nucleotide alpha hydrolase (AANH) superfamily ATPase|nr:epoxyqueuosine reductase QueH [Lachnospiraceae bacterium]